MPLLLCPNDNGPMQTVHRSGVEFDMCPTCRGVWLDRGELEKLLSAARDESTGNGSSGPPAAPPFLPPSSRTATPTGRRDWDDDDDDRRRKKRPSIFDIFD